MCSRTTTFRVVAVEPKGALFNMFPTPAERKVAARSQEINDRGMELQ